MRIHLLSDLHLEHSDFSPVVEDADVVILAGDIHIKARGVEWAQKAFPCTVLYVPGNHEFYGGHLSLTLLKMRARECERVRVLDRDEVLLGGVRFLGCTMWTDYACIGNAHLAAWHARTTMNDFRKIRTEPFRRIVPNDLVQESLKSREWLSTKLAEPFVGKTVVITHHAPSLRSLQDNPDAGTLLDAAYVNDCEDMIREGHVALWVHGHSHHAVDYEINGSRVICNPRGYPGEETGFDPRWVLTL